MKSKHRGRDAQKRAEQRRARRDQRRMRVQARTGHKTGAGSRAGKGPRAALRTWITDPFAVRASGLLTVALTAEEPSGTWLVGVKIALLAGGYLETVDLFSREKVAAGQPDRTGVIGNLVGASLFRDDDAYWGKYLKPAPVPLAARLVWGALAYSISLGAYAPDESEVEKHRKPRGLPALGYLPPPPGHPIAWVKDFIKRFDDNQIGLAEDRLTEVEDWASLRARPLDAGVVVEIHLEADVPLTVFAEVDSRPLEFIKLSSSRYASTYLWTPVSSQLVQLADAELEDAHGMLWLFSSGAVGLKASDVTSAADLVMRLKELVPSLRFKTCHWDERSPDDDDDDESALVVP